MRWILPALVLVVGCYDPGAHPVCQIQCAVDPVNGAPGPCPSGLSCMSNGLCGNSLDDCSERRDDAGATDTNTVGNEILLPRCGLALDGTIAEYPVDGDAGLSVVRDTVGTNLAKSFDGTTATAVQVTTSSNDCGEALDLAGQRNAVIADSSAFNLSTGSFDLWVRPPMGAAALANVSRVIVARDNSGNNLGDVALFHHHSTARGNIFVLRLQSGVASELGAGTYRCSAPITPGTWYRVAVNFGAPGVELLVDGAPQAATGDVFVNNETWPCGMSVGGEISTVGIHNGLVDKPWTLGAGIIFDGSASTRYYTGGAIDHFRISSVRHPAQ